MEITVIYIVLTTIAIGILWHLFCHLMIMFHSDTTDKAVEELLKNPRKYLTDEHACYFIRNMVYLFFVSMLLVAACKGNIHFNNDATEIETGNINRA